MSLDVCVKEEAEMVMDMNEAHEVYSYTEHEIKSEVDIGPELLQAPSIYVSPDVQEDSTNVMLKKEFHLKLHSSCSVVLERLPLSKLHKKMVLTNAEKQKQDRDQLRVRNPAKSELIEKRKNLQEHLNDLIFRANYRIKEQLHTNRKDNKKTSLPKSNRVIENLPNNSEQKKEKRKRRRLECPKTCEYCQRAFQCHFLMKRHQKIHVKQLLYTNADNIAANFGYIKPESEVPYTCEVCWDFFVDESDFMKHMQIHGLLVTLTKQSEEKRDNFTFALTEAINTRYYCVTCAKVWRVPFDFFAKHLLEHIEENPILKQILTEFVSSDPIERSCIGQTNIFSCRDCNYTSHHERAFRKHIIYPHVTNKNEDTNSTKGLAQWVVVLPAAPVPGSNPGKDKLQSDKPANATNDSPPVLSTKRPSILAAALTSNKTQKEIYKDSMATNLESINESIDFQKSSLFSRLKLLSKVVGK